MRKNLCVLKTANERLAKEVWKFLIMIDHIFTVEYIRLLMQFYGLRWLYSVPSNS